MTKPRKNDSKESPEDILKKIKPNRQAKDRFQLWYPDLGLLWFACGNGKDTVFISSSRKLAHADKPLRSKLTQGIVECYRKDQEIVSSSFIISKLTQILQGYIFFEDSRLYSLVSIWIIGTYLYTMFGNYGYLYFYSKLMRSGKTRTQEIISHLAFEASNPQNAPTPPVIRELAADGGTVQLDTLERWRDKNQESFSAAMEMLDAGFRNGGQVSKMVQNGKGTWVKECFPVYAPYVLSGIYKDSLADTALDRSFVIEAKRKPAGMKKKSYNYAKCEKAFRILRGLLYLWALQNAKEVCRIYQSKELQAELDQLHLNDRAVDIWLPILAVAWAAGYKPKSKEWAELTTLAKEMGGDPEYAEEARHLAMIRALRKLADGKGKVVGITSDLVKQIQKSKIEIKARGLTAFLTLWGFKQKQIRFPKGPRRAWELEDKRLAEVEQQLCAGTIP